MNKTSTQDYVDLFTAVASVVVSVSKLIKKFENVDDDIIDKPKKQKRTKKEE